jgi:hypothetical protein
MTVRKCSVNRLNGRSGKSGTGVVRDVNGKLVVGLEERKKVWKRYFEGLGHSGGDQGKFDDEFKECVESEVQSMKDRSCHEFVEMLDGEMDVDDIRVALSQMRNGKAPGDDGILTEVLKGGGDAIVNALTVLFNNVWKSELVPVEWGKGVIVPLFKMKGERDDCGNYRGISLLSIVGKVFCRVLNARLMLFVEENELVDEQGGFRPGRGTVDVLYVWSEVVRGRRLEGKETFCAFIDVQKAYDRVWRDGLWKRLWDSGIRGKMWRVIQNMYSEVTSCVMVDGEKTEWFDTSMGVRQGCVLSPVLYSIFINGFAKELLKRGLGGVDVGLEKLRMLLFADDIVLFADGVDELNDMLKVLEEYSRSWRFEINVDKSKVMVCGGEKRKVTEVFVFGDKQMESVEEFKYVGVVVSRNGEWRAAVKSCLMKVKVKLDEFKWWLGRHWEVSPKIKVEVWKVMVGSILRYGSEVWFATKNEDRDLESIQLQWFKNVLRVSGSTSSHFIRGELAVFELKRLRDIALLGWQGKLWVMDENRWPRKVFKHGWGYNCGVRSKSRDSKVNELLKEYDLSDEANAVITGELPIAEWVTVVKTKVENVAVQEWRKGVNECKKLRLYEALKKDWGFESYLEDGYRKGEVLMCRFRSGSAAVGAETKKWNGGREDVLEVNGKLKKKCGLCKVCNTGSEENIEHVLLECSGYAEDRKQWEETVDSIKVQDSERVKVQESFSVFNPLILMLRGAPELSIEGRLRLQVASTRFFVQLWSKRSTYLYGRRISESNSCGTNDLNVKDP